MLDHWPGRGDEREHALGCHRPFGDPHARAPERIFDGVGQRGGGCDGAPFAHAFHTERVPGRWTFEVDRCDLWYVARLGDRVIHQGTCEELPGAVVDDLLEQARPNPLGDPAVHQALDDLLVVHVVAVVRHDVYEH